MFVLDLLLLTPSSVLFPDPRMSRVFVHPEVACCLGNRLIRLDGQFDRALLKLRWILFHRGDTHRTHLSGGTRALVSVCPEEYSHIMEVEVHVALASLGLERVLIGHDE